MNELTLIQKEILSKSHYGLNIYAYVLRQYYQEDIAISLCGSVSKVIKNPFLGNRLSLKIQKNNYYFEYFDEQDGWFKGSVFDFALLHFKCDDSELCNLICQALNLKISVLKPGLTIPETQLLIPTFSFFRRPVSNISPCRVCNVFQIYHYIKSEYAVNATYALRNMSDPKESKFFKSKNFDYVTFSGLFSSRDDKFLLKHSGLICLDFDNLIQKESLKEKLLQDVYFETELLFVSPSGNGLKWIVSIDVTMHTHNLYFQGIEKYLIQQYKHQVDRSGKDISRACFLPHDPNVFVNPKYRQDERAI